jgi:hypothetical protein
MSGCQGPCDQGRKECPTPWACQIEVDDSPTGETPWREFKTDVFLAAVLSGVVIIIAVLIAGVL